MGNLNEIFELVSNILGGCYVYNKDYENTELYISKKADTKKYVFFPTSIASNNFDSNYISHIFEKAEIDSGSGGAKVKEILKMCVDGDLNDLVKHLDMIFHNTTTYNSFLEDDRVRHEYLLSKEKEEKRIDKNKFEADRQKISSICDKSYEKAINNLSNQLKEEQFASVFEKYGINAHCISNDRALFYLIVLIADRIRNLKIHHVIRQNDLQFFKKYLECLSEEIVKFVRENNLGSGKLTCDDFLCFTDVSPKDSDYESDFKRISEFFIAPTLSLNNINESFRCLVEGNSGVGKTTLLKAINNIFVIENTDTTEFSDDEKCWYKNLKSKLFINSDRSYFPIFIEAKKANDQIEPYNLLDLADKYEKSLLENFVSCNDEVKALLLVDGIEEIESEQKRPLFEEAFKKFFENEKHTNVSVIVTTRYSEPFECVRSYREKITLRKLEFDSVKNYVRTSMLISSENRENIISFMSKNTDLQNFVCTPFFFEKLISNYSNKLTVYEYLKKSIDSIIELRWFKARNFTKELLGYIAIKGKTHSYSDFNYLISNLPESLNASLENDTKKSIKQEYDIFKSKWDSQSGILSYKTDGGERVAFEEPLAMSYLASLYIFRWFSYIEKKHNDLCDGLKDPWNIDYFKHFKLIELIDQNFDLTNIDVLRAFSLFLSRNTEGINNGDEDRNNDDDDRKMFEDRIVTMAVFLKFLSVNNNDKRLNIQSFFAGLKNRDLGISMFSNPTKDPAQISFKTSVDFMVLDEARGEANG